MREYETVYLLKPDLPPDQLSAIKDKFTHVIAEAKGHLLSQGDWGKRKLAYDVQKNHHGHYIYLRYLGPEGLVGQFERLLGIEDSVMKFLTVRLSDEVNVQERLAKKEEAPAAPEEVFAGRAPEGGPWRRGGGRGRGREGGPGDEGGGGFEVPEEVHNL
jgi:small subunit ribosomal protein S6